MQNALKPTIIVILSLICVALILFVSRQVLARKNEVTSHYTVINETVKNEINISGTVSAAQQQNLQALSAGTVIAVAVKKGDTVKKGDLLIQLDDTTEKYNLSKLDYDIQKAQLSGSSRELELMYMQRDSLVQKINERKIVAQFDGIVVSLNVSVGSSLEAKDTVGHIVDVSYLTARVEVAETDAAKLQVGQRVELTFPVYDKIVVGSITDWPTIGEVTNRGATIVKADIRIDEYPDCILPNFSFSGKIKIGPDEHLVLVNRYAIGYNEGKAFVELLETGEQIQVKAQNYNSEYVQILAGLFGGEVLKAQSTARVSGQSAGNRRQQGNTVPNNMPTAPGGTGNGGLPRF